MKRIYNNKTGKEVAIRGSAALPYVNFAGKKMYVLTTAITSGVTTDSVGAVAGDFAVTTNTTGRGALFFSDGTNWVAIGDGGAGFTQGAAVADPAAITATNPTAPTAYSAVTNMTDPVTKAEGEAVSAALATLRGEVATYELAISALVTDLTEVRTAVVNLITSLENGDIIA